MRSIVDRILRSAYAYRWDVGALAGAVAFVVGLWWERPSVAMAVGGLGVVALSIWRDWANGRKK